MSTSDKEDAISQTIEVRMSFPQKYYANFEELAQEFDQEFVEDDDDDDTNILEEGILPRVVPKSHPIPDDSNFFFMSIKQRGFEVL